MFAIKTRDFACRFAIDRALFQIAPFITRVLALTNSKLRFELSVFPIELQDNQGVSFDLRFAVEFVDLLPVEQKFARAFRRWNFVTGFFVRLNVGVVEKRFTTLDASKSVADVRFAGAN